MQVSKRGAIMSNKKRSDQVAGGVFLIGLALLFYFGYWWPGILFVIGASSMARGVAEGRDWYSVPGGLWMIGLGLVFAFGFSLPMLLILIGVSMLFGRSWHGSRESRHAVREKAKHEEKAKRDTYIISDEEDPDEVTVEDLIRHDNASM